MAAKVDIDQCVGCGDCVNECPSEAIEMNDDSKAQVNEDTCVDCGACVDVCPSGAITLD